MNKYKKVRRNGKQVYEHRWVWAEVHGPIPKGMQVHHINNNKSDNRIENLRLVTHQQNKNMSDCWGKGYCYKEHEFRPYVAYRTMNKITKTIGRYGTACGAYMASRMYFLSC
tara:strand:+ start:222 stop:557 length:336 start_codon:yes stop_codon:yes gene_type:complete